MADIGTGDWKIVLPEDTLPYGINVKFKRLTGTAKAPVRGSADAAGWDLTADKLVYNDELPPSIDVFHTGIAVAIPKGYVGLLFPRSSIRKTDYSLANSIGVIDSDYRGEILVNMRAANLSGKFYEPGDRIAQLIIVPYPQVKFEEVEELDGTQRGTGGHGSTGE